MILNLPLFFAKRMRQPVLNKDSVSHQIINIATIAVTLGIITILIAVATGRGLQKEIRKKTAAFNGHLVVMPFENNSSKISLLSFKNNLDFSSIWKTENPIIYSYGFAIKAGMLKAGEEFEGILFKGVDSNFESSELSDFMREGEIPNWGENNSDKIVISQRIADRLELHAGETVEAYFQNSTTQRLPNKRKFTVSGIFSTGFPDIDKNLILGDLNQIQRLNRWGNDQIGGYQIFLKEPNQIENITEEIYQYLPPELDAQSLNDQYSSIFQWISLFDFNILVIMIIMLLVGVINMATALLVLILERSRMVGLLKALGAPHRMIQNIFLYNGIVIMSKGLLIGNILGLLFYFTQQQWGWIQLDPETYFVDKAPVILTFYEIFAVNLIFLLISALLLWLPSRIIISITPAKVLRFR